MTVKQLIESLKEHDPDMEIIYDLPYPGGEINSLFVSKIPYKTYICLSDEDG